MSSKCCLESLSQISSEANSEDLNPKFSLGGDVPQTLLVGKHAFTRYYHSVFPPPPTQNPVWNSAEQRTIALYPGSFLVACNTIVPRLFLVKERPWVRDYCTLFCKFLTLTLPWAEEEMNLGMKLRVQWIYCWTSIKGRAHTCFLDAWISNKSTKCIWAPLLAEVQRYDTSKAAMQSKYMTESPLISTRDCHICGFDYIALYRVVYCWTFVNGAS